MHSTNICTISSEITLSSPLHDAAVQPKSVCPESKSHRHISPTAQSSPRPDYRHSISASIPQTGRSIPLRTQDLCKNDRRGQDEQIPCPHAFPAAAGKTLSSQQAATANLVVAGRRVSFTRYYVQLWAPLGSPVSVQHERELLRRERVPQGPTSGRQAPKQTGEDAAEGHSAATEGVTHRSLEQAPLFRGPCFWYV